MTAAAVTLPALRALCWALIIILLSRVAAPFHTFHVWIFA